MSEWKIIPEHPDYEVRDDGAVRRATDGHVWKKGREKSQWDHNGYWCVKISKNGSRKSKSAFVHRLVAMAFLPPRPSELHEIAHNDGDRKNNHCSNLRWATRTENVADTAIHGTRSWGERNGHARLTVGQVSDIRQRLAIGGITQRELAIEYGISQPHVSAIKAGRFWKEAAMKEAA